jgi:hypothetical protein
MNRKEKVVLTLALIALGAFMGAGYNLYAGGNTIRYDIPLKIGDSLEASNAAIETVLKNPNILRLTETQPCKIIAIDKIMIRGQGTTVNGSITNSWYDITINPSSNGGPVEISGVYHVVVITILYTDLSGYYVVYDTETGNTSEPVYVKNILQATK